MLGDVRKLFRRVLVDLLIGNTDAHFKNFALAKQNGLFRLTPNYDKVSCVMFSENRHERYVSVALDVGGKKVRNIGEVDSKRLILMAYEFQLTPDELVADVRAIKDRLVTLDPVIDAASKVDLVSAKHLRDCVRKRWNGAFDQIEGALVKSKPKNNYADKTSRKEAEKAWEEKVGRPVLIRSPDNVGRFTL